MKTFKERPLPWQHKKAVEALEKWDLLAYRAIEKALELPPIDSEHEALSHRFHYHLKEAGLSRKEHNFLYVTTEDKPSAVPHLPYAIYLDNLRSGFNVGSIIRTVEALRLGMVCFSKSTPFIDNKKVQDAAMGTIPYVECKQIADLKDLPRPFIAIETVESATPIKEFTFPKSGTILLGNEEYGLSQDVLAQADYIVSIPLVGMKNSLNVANAFAMVAAHLR